MKKSYKFVTTICLIIAMSYYLAYIDKPLYSNIGAYINSYLNNPQHYLYIITVYSICILWYIFVPYMQPCYYLRISNLNESINKRNIFFSLIYGVLTFLIYVISAKINGYDSVLDISYILIVCKLVLYYFMCFSLSTSIYLLSGKPILSVLSLYFINLFVICLYYAINFFVYTNSLLDTFYEQLFVVYILVMSTASVLFNEIYLKRKEII